MSGFVVGARGIYGIVFLCPRWKWSLRVEDAQIFVTDRGANRALSRAKRKFEKFLTDFGVITLEDTPVDKEQAC